MKTKKFKLTIRYTALLCFFFIINSCELLTPTNKSETGTLTVLTEDSDGKPVKGAEIILAGQADYSKKTNSGGSASFAGIPLGEYQINVKSENYLSPKQETATLTNEDVKEVKFILELKNELSISDSILNFTASSLNKTITLSNRGSKALSWTLDENISWITAEKQQGSISEQSSEELIISAETSGLAAGDYQGVLTIAGTNGEGSYKITTKLSYTPLFPVAELDITSGGNGYLSTIFMVDASDSYDDIDHQTELMVRWTWEEGETPTQWTATKTASHQYTTVGEKKLTLEVMDIEGNIGTKTRTVIINSK